MGTVGLQNRFFEKKVEKIELKSFACAKGKLQSNVLMLMKIYLQFLVTKIKKLCGWNSS